MKKYIFFILYLIPLLSMSQPTNYLVLDDSEDIKISNSDNINTFLVKDRTIELWFKADDALSTDYQVLYEEGGKSNGFNIFMYDGDVYLGAWSESNSWYGTWFRNSISSNTWYHVALVLDDSNSKIRWYLDGVLQDARDGYNVNSHSGDIYLNSKGKTVLPETNTPPWSNGAIGEFFEASSDQGNGDFGDGFNGAVGFVRVWNTARSQIDIQDNKNTIYDTSDLDTDANPDPRKLVAFLNGDHFEYVDDGGDEQDTDVETDGKNGVILPKLTPTDYIWDGYEDSDWNNPNNWISLSLPEIGDNIKIEIENAVYDGADIDPVFPSGIYYYNNFEVSSASTFDVGSSSNINVTGDFTNNGTTSISGGTFNVTGNSTNYGTTSISGGAFNNKGYILNRSTFNMNSGKITITEGLLGNDSGGTFNFNSGEIIVDGGNSLWTGYSFMNWSNSTFILGTDAKYTGISPTAIFYNEGIFTIKSDATGTGSLITNGTVSNVGTMAVERYINTGTWQLLSSPTDNEKSEVVYGSFLNYFNEVDGDFYAVKSRTYDLVEGDGYVVKWKDEFASGTNPLVFSKDKPNTGNVPIALNITPEEVDPDNGMLYSNTYFDLPVGFNLVGNPYPSRINWNMLYNRNSGAIDASYYRYKDNAGDPGNGAWHAYLAEDTSTIDKDSIISMGQGFGVVLTDNTTASSLMFSDAVRTHNMGEVGFGKRTNTVSHSFNLVASSNRMSDDVNFRINENSTSDYDGHFDAYKLNSFGDTPTPSFISSDNKKLAICQQPESESVDLGFNMATSGEVTFSVSNVSYFTELVLEDKQEGIFTDLIKGAYTFNYSDEDAETGRFTLHFKQETLSEVEELTGIKIYSNSSNIIFSSEKSLNNVEVELYNISGQKILSKHFDSLRYQEINTSLNGVYILKLSSDNGVYTSKLILN